MPLKRGQRAGKSCAVYGCSNCWGKLQLWNQELCELHGNFRINCCSPAPYQLHRFPNSKEMSDAWLAKLRREKFKPTENSRVCSTHFVDGRPTSENPIPDLNLGYSRILPKKRPPPKIRGILPTVKHRKTEDECQSFCMPDSGLETGGQTNSETCGSIQPKRTRSIGTQVNFGEFTSRKLEEKNMKFYTGLNIAMFFAIAAQFKKSISNTAVDGFITAEEQLLLILVRLRLNLRLKDLAFRFKLSLPSCSKIFSSGIVILSKMLSDAIVWLPKERIQASMPEQFSELFPNTTCIMDCSEIFTQRPTCLMARAKLYSHYKAHNTVKFLVAVAPNGLIMFISRCYGGRASDKFICQDSGFYNYLDPQNEVMADRGFDIEQELAQQGVSLNIPAFTRGNRLSNFDCTKTRRIASVRIHVERVIGRIKNYSILKSVLPITSMKYVDRIVHVCAALTNLQGSIITSKSKFK